MTTLAVDACCWPCENDEHDLCSCEGPGCECHQCARPPKRIQLRRAKGWRKPVGAIVVARPTRWGNPYTVGDSGEIRGHARARGWAGRYDADREWSSDLTIRERLTAADAVALFRSDMEAGIAESAHEHPEDREHRLELIAALDELRGHDLACWCPLDQPCHADVLLELANR